MIFVTSDLHGDIERFRQKEIKRLKKTDTLIILGDFGFIWDGSKKEQKNLKWISRRRYTVLFIDGSHENFDLLSQYPVVDYAGGQAHEICGKLHHLMRGQVYNIEGQKLLCFGGGESLDKESRTEGNTWWHSEAPNHEEFDRCMQSLKKVDNAVDYILTHDAPSKLSTFLHLDKNTVLYEKTPIEAFFDNVYQYIPHKMWVFGRYHRDQRM
ncbi:MAG: metallophosphoesterase, partial [Oscillospiraceae bacterium]